MKKKGFTLIEVIVVIAVIGFVLPALFSIIFSILKQQVQVYYLAETKREGDYVLSTLQTLMRPTVEISMDASGSIAKCAKVERYPVSGYDNGSAFYFTDNTNTTSEFYLYTNNGKGTIKYKQDVSSLSPAADLTTDKVTVTSFQLACERLSTYSPPTLTLIFTLHYDTSTATTPLTYRTKIVLRNQ